MKTYAFHFIGGHIGGSGVVVANNEEEAIALANTHIELSSWIPQPITADNLTLVSDNSCHIISNGDY